VFAPGSVIAGVPREGDRAARQRAREPDQRLGLPRNAQRTRAGDQRAWTGDEYEAWLAHKRAEVERDADL
jgi:hypothetical protein